MPRLPIVAAYPLAALVALASLGGLFIDDLYARETANWAAQSVGQDWVDLVFAVPWLLLSGLFAQRGSRAALLLLAGGIVYTFYEFVIYAFALHFNAFFLVYCAVLGLSFFSLAGIALSLVHAPQASGPTPSARAAGIFLLAVGVLFALLWLKDIVGALVQQTTPPAIVEAGTATNPVYVMDLSIVLPLHVMAGWALLRRRAWGYVLGPIMLAFGVLMALSIGGMMLVMRQRGIEASLGVATVMFLVSAASGVLLTFALSDRRASRYGVAGHLFEACPRSSPRDGRAFPPSSPPVRS